MSSLKTSRNKTPLAILKSLATDITFELGNSFYWSPKHQIVTYSQDSLKAPEGVWSLLHETAHGLLDHRMYETDFELLTLEVAAWKEAKQLGLKLDIAIEENYVQDCLDTYRDWLHRRSTCPTCGNIGLQHSSTEYKCHNCHSSWHVTAARFCRPYRRKNTSLKEKPPDSIKNQTTFQ